MSTEQQNGSASSAIYEVMSRVNTQMVGKYKPDILEALKYKLRILTEQTRLERASAGACEKASVSMIVDLCGKFPDLFPIMALLTSRNPTVPLKGDWTYHTGVLLSDAPVLSTDGSWYVLSPANYQPNMQKGIIKDTDLQVVLNQFQMEEGGSWPSASYILGALKQNEYINPALRTHETSKGFITNRLDVTRFVNQTVNGDQQNITILDDVYVG